MNELMQQSYTVRAARMEDAREVTDLLIAFDIAEFGVPDCTIEDIFEIWSDLPLETNTWVIVHEDRIVAYGFLEERRKGRVDCNGFVHPEWNGKGIGSLLVNLFEQRAVPYITQYKEEGITYEFNNFIPAKNEAAISILESKGYKLDKVFSRMVIDLTSEPEVPALADDISLLPFDMNRDAKGLHEAYVESFKDTRSFNDEPFEKWIIKKTTEQYDQSLWYVAYFQSELVGYIVCKNFPEGTYVELLGVKRSGRRKGIGASLLKTVFRESFKRDIRTVLLNVDANSLTNANKLYESVGMKAAFQNACYTKQD